MAKLCPIVCKCSPCYIHAKKKIQPNPTSPEEPTKLRKQKYQTLAQNIKPFERLDPILIPLLNQLKALCYPSGISHTLQSTLQVRKKRNQKGK